MWQLKIRAPGEKLRDFQGNACRAPSRVFYLGERWCSFISCYGGASGTLMIRKTTKVVDEASLMDNGDFSAFVILYRVSHDFQCWEID